VAAALLIINARKSSSLVEGERGVALVILYFRVLHNKSSLRRSCALCYKLRQNLNSAVIARYQGFPKHSVQVRLLYQGIKRLDTTEWLYGNVAVPYCNISAIHPHGKN
jgi:hypothetical protein